MQKHRKSYQLSRWDYQNTGDYFVTICTENEQQYFGKIADPYYAFIISPYYQSVSAVPAQSNKVVKNTLFGALGIDSNIEEITKRTY